MGQPGTRASRKSQRGVSLIEMAVAIAVMGILGVGISSMMYGAVENQIHQEIHMHQQSTLSSLVFQLRVDGTQATTVTRDSATQFTLTTSNGDTIVYSFAGGTATRSVNGSTPFNYLSLMPRQYRANHTISCGGGGVDCVNEVGTERISIRQLSINDNSALMGQLENAFGQKSFFLLPEVSIATMQGYQFQ